MQNNLRKLISVLIDLIDISKLDPMMHAYRLFRWLEVFIDRGHRKILIEQEKATRFKERGNGS